MPSSIVIQFTVVNNLNIMILKTNLELKTIKMEFLQVSINNND